MKSRPNANRVVRYMKLQRFNGKSWDFVDEISVRLESMKSISFEKEMPAVHPRRAGTPHLTVIVGKATNKPQAVLGSRPTVDGGDSELIACRRQEDTGYTPTAG